ncbi:hypothetical protein G8759_02835 [Spirosoma aureum]|uniref:Uncharacterized protein n=1 Tax=Spirosoma aureum TaxID=2692134 RepID=A0A6G9AGP1_9BACT|nr:hypothetical protein [Spirosoma aureum]QIP11642.1 hypothetical protein G8759_02835 [Spirosoma aureum]
MKKLALSSLAMLSAFASTAQNHISISQQGSPGNHAMVSQSGSGNSVIINQNSTDSSSSGQTGNRISLRVDKNTQTTINQRSDGPNSVELSQEGQSSAIINQSSGTDNNTVTLLPGQKPVTHQPRTPKRRQRR